MIGYSIFNLNRGGGKESYTFYSQHYSEEDVCMIGYSNLNRE